ncbi:MAG: hypothetical protein F4X38_09125 [Acidimicrobiaceae bacterium]|nr:hypothetical protein [Acidimicrobiaceae bacterium]
MTLLGVDIGTTGCKAAVVSTEGALQASAYREYPLITPRSGWAQLDPDEVWDAVCSAIREVTSADVTRPRAMAVATLGEAVTPIDSRGRALGPSILSFDRRAAACHDRLVGRIGRDELERITGLAPMPHYTVSKWSWLASEAPDTYRAAAKLLCYGDLVAARLGLEPVIDHTMATRTLALDQISHRWDAGVLEAAGVEEAKLPVPAPPGTVIGTIPRQHCIDLGLASGAALVAGGLDQACAAHAVGVDRSGSVLLSLGTVAVLAMALDGDQPRPLAIPTGPHVVEGRSLAVAGAPAGGAVLRWYRDVLGAADREQAEAAGADFYDIVVSTAATVETEAIVVPHFAGSRAAFSDPNSLGVIAGLTFDTDRRRLVRALLEGVALETAVMAERLGAAVGPITSLRAAGGGSKSAPWMQIFADVLGVPVESAASSYAAAVGAALIAGAAVGVVDCGATMPIVARFEPDEARAEAYRGKLALYRRLYETMATVRRSGRGGAPPSAGET